MGGGHLVGHREALRRLELLLGLGPVAGDRALEVRGRLALGIVEQVEERLRDLTIGLRDQAARLRVVVAQAALASVGRATTHEEEQDQREEQDPADQDGLADEHRLAIAGGTARPRAAWSGGPTGWFVVLVEEGQVR